MGHLRDSCGLLTLTEGKTTGSVDGVAAGISLPAANRDVDVQRIDLDPTTNAARALRSDQRTTATQERIEHDVAPVGAVQNGVGHEPHRFDRGMQSQ